jgi:hypothetical protein
MKIISHRGNIHGPNPHIENNPHHINNILNRGIDVEIDLWYVDGSLYLGHDEPSIPVDENWLMLNKNKLWVHLKNLNAISAPIIKHLNYFWHENDKFTLTSKGIPWCFPNVFLETGVTVTLSNEKITKKILGLCTDYVEDYI